MKVSVLGIGVQKAGTTTLYSHLVRHKSFAKPFRKELHYFDDETIDWTSPDYSVLENQFVGEGIRFEVTPIYIYWPNCLERIKQYNPNIKLIALFRNPIDRMLSHWKMNCSQNWEKLSFSEAIRSNDRFDTEDRIRTFSYMQRCFYGYQCERLLKIFSRDQLLFLSSNDMFNNRQHVLEQLSDFLEVTRFENTELILNSSYGMINHIPNDEDVRFVTDHLRDDMKLFKDITGINFL